MTLIKAEQYCSLLLIFTLGFWRTGINIFLGLLLIFFIIRLLNKEKNLLPTIQPSIIKTGVIYFTTYFIAIIFSSNHLASYYNLIWFFTRFTPFVIVWFIAKNEFIRKQFWTTLALGIICSSIIVFIQAYFELGNIGRPGGFLGVLNFAGAIGIITSCLLPLTFDKNQSANKRAFFVIAIILANIALFLNGTRGVLLANVFTYFMAAYFYFGINKKTLLIVILMSLFVFFAMFSGKSSRGSLTTVSSQSSVTARLDMLEMGWSTFKNNFIVGVGPGMVPSYSLILDENGRTSLEIIERSNPKDFIHLHNLYMQTIVETGIIGFVGIFVFYGNLLVIFYKNFKKSLIFLSCFMGLFSFLLHGMTDYVYGFTSEMILIFFVVAIGLFESVEGSTKSNIN